MSILGRNYEFLIVCGIITGLYFWNPIIGQLIGCIAFQTILLISMISSVRLRKRIAKSTIVTGRLVNVRLVDGIENKDYTYEGVIEFFWPSDNERHHIVHAFSTFWKPKLGRSFSIYLNAEDPSKSHLVTDFGANFLIRFLASLAMFSFLSYVDWIYLKKIIHEVKIFY